MNTERKTKLNINPVTLALRVAVLLLLVVLYVTVPMYAWFYQGRRAAAIAEISDPTAIFINAGNREDIRYMDLAGIDVEEGGTEFPEGSQDEGKKYKDYVFCVRGFYVDTYRLQLAYTTNNQFEYRLYRATLANGAAPNDNLGETEYKTHPANGESVTQIYYIANGSDPLSGVFLNEKTGTGQFLALDDDTYHDRTYAVLPDNDPEGTIYDADNINKYAEPLYWQTSGNQASEHMTDGRLIPQGVDGVSFCDYFILRVVWDAETSKNDRETDIIYITARNTSS